MTRSDPGYLAPTVAPLGTAAALIRRSPTGQQKDGAGGWYTCLC